MTYGYLEHHGIKGQKWGVRNGPPYPIGTTVKRHMRRMRKLEKDAEENGSSVTGSKMLDKAYNKIAGMDQNDWKKVKTVAAGAGIAAGLASTMMAVTALSAATAYIASDPQLVNSILSDIGDLGINILGSDRANKLLESLGDKAPEFLTNAAEKYSKGLAEKMMKGLDPSNSSSENYKIIKNLKDNISKEDFAKFLNSGIIDKKGNKSANWDIIKNDPRLLDLVADRVTDAKDLKALTNANANFKAISQANQNRTLNMDKKVNKFKKYTSTATAVGGGLLGVTSMAGNIYRMKDTNPIIKDTIGVVKNVVGNRNNFYKDEEVKKKHGK